MSREAELIAENERLRNERDSFRELSVSLQARAEQAEARVAALEAALVEMGNAMEAGAYDAAWTIRNAALARPAPTPEGEQG